MKQAAYFRREVFATCSVWLKLRQRKESIFPQFLASCHLIWPVVKIISEDVNCVGEFWNSAPIIVYDIGSAGLYKYATNGVFFLNACRKLMACTIKNANGPKTDKQTRSGGN